MFGLLRRARPVPRAPLLDLRWDGRELRLACTPRALAAIALELDGCHFATVVPDADGRARFAFAFAPSGAASAELLPRAGRDGAALAAGPVRLEFGRARSLAASAGSRRAPLAPLAASRLVPFGRDVAAREVVVVVPVHNAPALVERCLAAVRAHLDPATRVIVIDDASTDAAIAPLLARAAGFARVLRNDSNRGFTATANRGIAEAGRADVVLLNADAEVGPNWLAGLRRAAYAADDIASATAVSDNAGAFSVPELERDNPLPPAWTTEHAARANWLHAGLAYPELPTGNGFCMYLRRDAIDAVGVLDEAAFPQGYGEENDWSQRAAQRGLRHVVAGNVFVRHARSASFGEARRAALGRAGMAVLRERWPQYESDVARTLFSYERLVLDWRVRRIRADAGDRGVPLQRLLWVGEGAPAWRDAEVWNLRANGARNELVHAGRVVAASEWVARDPEPSYRALWDWLQLHAIEALLVREPRASVAEILCGLLGIPRLRIADPSARSATEALRTAECLPPARVPPTSDSPA
ncbi:glycosyltransferase [Dokdonella sp.]|uniref:glycosyltransferase n=1 Tax=Dokdonella sp. TaxID=2291710 RepID=UPI002F405A8B